jgi:hypothetical protein
MRFAIGSFSSIRQEPSEHTLILLLLLLEEEEEEEEEEEDIM